MSPLFCKKACVLLYKIGVDRKNPDPSCGGDGKNLDPSRGGDGKNFGALARKSTNPPLLLNNDHSLSEY